MRVPGVVLPILLALACGGCGDVDGAGQTRVSTDVGPTTGGDGGAAMPDGCVADPGGGPVRYRVQRGDTLISIARTVYGDGRMWREIVRANEDLADAPDALRVGDELVIPFEGH